MPITDTDTNRILAINQFNKIKDISTNTNTKTKTNTDGANVIKEDTINADITDKDYNIIIDNDNDMETLNKTPTLQSNTNIFAGGSDTLKKNPIKDKSTLTQKTILKKDSIQDINTDYTPSPQIFTIDYLFTSDKDLINEEHVIATVDKYISNYNSEHIKTYTQAFKNLYQKYSRKQYIIKNINNKVIVIKNMFEHVKKNKEHGKSHGKHKQNKSNMPDEIIFELNKPHYLFYDNNNNLTLLKKQISNERVALQYEYQNLINKINVELPEKKQFEKQRQTFIDLLETYYIYVLYHKKINQIIINNKTSIILQRKTNIYSENVLLEGMLTYIDNSDIDLINKCNTDTLNQYNELIIKMSTTGQDNLLPDTIKAYITKLDEIKNIYNTIQEQNKHQNNIINYIITKLP